MISLSPRRLLSACALTVALAALAAPGAANASFPGTLCSGENITGEGSSAQNLGHKETWGPDFSSPTNGSLLSCNGVNGTTEKKTVTYVSKGSGEGMEQWGLQGHAVETARVSFVGTDEPPSKAFKEEIEEKVDKEGGGKKNTIYTEPVTQFAVAVIVHLPEECTASGEPKKHHPEGRLVLNNTTLEAIFAGEVTKWGEIKEGGDKVIGSGSKTTKECEEAEIQRVVRFDESGTTHVFKRYLALIKGTKYKTEKIGAGKEEENWSEMSEPDGNKNWPTGKGKPTITYGENGGGDLVKEVAAVPGSIGYAALSDSRNNKNFDGEASGGVGTNKFWAQIQSNGVGVKGKYQDPSTTGDSKKESSSNSNCGAVKYTNGAGKKFPPKKTSEAWNEVTTSTKQKSYPICGLTYDLLMKEYHLATGATQGQAQTVHDYFNFVFNETEPEGGQTLIENKDYYRLPAKLVKESQEGLALVKF